MRKLDDRIKQFVYDNHTKYTRKEIVEIIKERYGYNCTQGTIDNLQYHHRIEKGDRMYFKSGRHSPPHAEPIGATREIKNNNIEVKVGKRKWKRLTDMMWEIYNNKPLPKGYVVLALDSNRRNYSKDNLVAITRAELVRLNKKYKISTNADITRTNLLIAKVDLKTNDLIKNRGRNGR